VAKTSVTIVGGGLVGLTSALFLSERDVDVRVIDSGPMGSGASRGNAGFMCQALVAPLPGPGVIQSTMKSLTDPTSALRLRPQAIPQLAPWMWHFTKACTKTKFEAGRAALGALNKNLPAILDRLQKAGVNVTLSPGVVVPFHDEKAAEHFFNDLKPMEQFGAKVPAEMLDGNQLRQIVPALTDHLRAGFLMPQDRAIDPRGYVDTLIKILSERGVELLENHTIERFDSTGERVTNVVTNKGRYSADQIVLSAGAGAGLLGKFLGLSLHIVPGQGYNVGLPTTNGLTNPVIFEEAHAVATPFADRIRLGGTMEFAGHNPSFDGRRVDAIITSLRKFVNLEYESKFDAWAGSRPMSADGLPLLGRPKKWTNVVVAGGHGMWGLTLAPATAEVVTELIVDGHASTDLAAFGVDRFSR
jgi:glycine/D-amino acid oxidase-like deaminating enzyme